MNFLRHLKALAAPTETLHQRWQGILVLRALLVTSMLFGMLQTLGSMGYASMTYDEAWHALWNTRLLAHGETERSSVANFKSTTPILLPNLWVAKRVEQRLRLTEHEQLFIKRVPNLLWFVVLVGATFLCAKLLGGPEAGYIAASAVSLEPNVLAHMSLLTADGAFAAAFVALLASLVWAVRHPTLIAAATAGAAFALTLLAKFTALLGAVPVGVTLSAIVLRRRPDFRKLLFALAVAAAVFVLVCCIGYRFDDIGVPFAELGFRSSPFQRIAAVAPWLRIPLPGALLTGIDHCLATERGVTWNVILLGRWYPDGTWLYFPVLWLYKTPLVLLAFTIVGLYLALRSGWWRTCRGTWIVGSAIVTASAYFLWIFRAQVGYRYVLFLVPPSLILAACGWSSRFLARSPRLIVVGAFLVGLEVLPYSGNMIAFTNLLIRDGQEYRYFADSNLDWGQNRERHAPFKKALLKEGRFNPFHILPGENAFEVNQLVGVWWNIDQHQWLREHLEPVKILDHTVYIYDVSQDAFEEFLRSERTLPYRKGGFVECEQSDGYQPLDADHAVQGEGGETRICLRTAKTASLRLQHETGTIAIGPVASWGGCMAKRLYDRAKAWFRLEPGVHQLCIASKNPWSALLETTESGIEVFEVASGD